MIENKPKKTQTIQRNVKHAESVKATIQNIKQTMCATVKR